MMNFAPIYRRIANAKFLVSEIDKRLAGPHDNIMEVNNKFLEKRKVIEQHVRWHDDDLKLDLSILLSNIVHQLTSALDNTAYLVIAASHTLTEGEKRKIFFPICVSKDSWYNNQTRRIIENYCHNKYQQIFIHVQPFRGSIGWHASPLQPLEVLKKFSNGDKHRVLPITRAAVQDAKINLGIKFFSEQESCNPGIELFRSGYRNGGLIKRVTSEFPIKSLSGSDALSINYILENFEIPVRKFAMDMITVVEELVYNFDQLQGVEDWQAPSP